MTELFLNALDSKAADVAAEWIRSHMPQVLAANLTPTQANALAPFLKVLYNLFVKTQLSISII